VCHVFSSAVTHFCENSTRTPQGKIALSFFVRSQNRVFGFTRSYVENGPVAVGAARRKQIVVVGLAVGRAVALKEVARAQLRVALLASEVLRVPGLAQRRDHLACRRNLSILMAFFETDFAQFLPKFQPEVEFRVF
jgi:hypothetical protein